MFTVGFAGWSRTGGRREGVAQVTAHASQFNPVSPITYRLPTAASIFCIGAGLDSIECILEGHGGQWDEARNRLNCGTYLGCRHRTDVHLRMSYSRRQPFSSTAARCTLRRDMRTVCGHLNHGCSGPLHISHVG
jgi:hypothetical protein